VLAGLPGQEADLSKCTLHALYATHHNFIRRHATIKTTPAVAAEVTYRPWAIRDLPEWSS
jgi:hypothetical protein